MFAVHGVYLIVLLTVVSSDTRLDRAWHSWKSLYGKQFNQSEGEQRLAKWKANVHIIQSHNLRHDLHMETYRMHLNEFAHMDWMEFKSIYLKTQVDVRLVKETTLPRITSPLPDAVDWRARDSVVTRVKRQV